MTTSTPPAWAWLEEKYVPVTTDPGYYPANVDEMCRNYTETELSIHSHKPPDSDAFCKRNDSDPAGEDVWPLERAASTTASSAVCADQCSECRCAPGQPHAPDCSGVQSVRETHTKLRVGAPNEHPAWVCNDCGQDRYGSPFGVSTWHGGPCDICGETKYVTEPRDFCGYHTLIPTTSPYFDGDPTCTVTAPETTSPADSCVVESCPECGTVTDIEYGEAASFSVPFRVQEFMFEELCEEKLAELPHLIFTHSERIIEMARDRFRKGFAAYGSHMYSWSPERRLDETLQELADSIVYLTSGSVETSTVTDKC